MNVKYIACSKAVVACELAGEMMIMSTVDSAFFSLNETAIRIWRAADGRTPLSEIVARHVCREFDVSSDEAYRDAAELAEALARRGIMVLSDQLIEEVTPKAVRSR